MDGTRTSSQKSQAPDRNCDTFRPGEYPRPATAQSARAQCNKDEPDLDLESQGRFHRSSRHHEPRVKSEGGQPMGVGGGGGGVRMGPVAVRVQNLSKEFRIGLRAERYKTLRDSIASMATAPLRVFRHRKRSEGDDLLLALDDVNFEIRAGEVVGIIGRNGAGKSTLLKILSRITEPTRGFAEIHGRVGSLLEVGTGFHPELTGRENIYLNGAILGMRRVEIERKFDEIVAFSEVEQFIDTPVKRYSSGMYLRLAFAVAAHMDTEILLVDEVLAVGDASFQKKCLGKMGEVAAAGRTVLFVSHNMGAVAGLCKRAIWIDEGTIMADGGVEEVAQ